MLSRAALALIVLGALTACRSVLGIEELDVTSVDAGVDSPADAPLGPTDSSNDAIAPPEASSPDGGRCMTLGASACRACCKNPPFAADYASLVMKLGQGCICGDPASAVCGPRCAGQPECPGSPASSSTAADCALCISDDIARGNDSKCTSQIAACKLDTACAATLACFRGCL